MKKTSIFISYYNSYPITSGSSAVTTSLFNSWPGKKKLFMMNHEANIKKKNIYNFFSPSNKPIFKIFLLIPYCIFIYFKIRKLNTKYIIFEGASWTGYILFTYIFLKIFLYKKKFIYHSHNVDFFFRQKSYIISKISFLFEKKILQNFDISTAVSIKDCKKFYQYFKVKTKVLPNGILINKKFLKKIKINTKYIIFSGSLEYEQNKKIVPFLCEDSKVFKNGKIIIKLPGVDNPEQARLSTGKEIFTTTADLPDLEDDGYYWHDLVGLSVINAAGHEFGRVEYLFNSGASDIMVVKSCNGTEVLIPYLDHVVIKVDLTECTMLIAWEE